MDIGSGKSIKHYVKSTIFGNLMEIYQNQSSIKYIFSKVIRSMIIICFSTYTTKIRAQDDQRYNGKVLSIFSLHFTWI